MFNNAARNKSVMNLFERCVCTLFVHLGSNGSTELSHRPGDALYIGNPQLSDFVPLNMD